MLLEVGTVIYVKGPFNQNRIVTVDRVLKRFAFAGGYKFYKEYEKRPRLSGFTFEWYAEIATPEIIARLAEEKKRADLINRIHGSLLTTLPTEDLEQIASLINWKLNEQKKGAANVN